MWLQMCSQQLGPLSACTAEQPPPHYSQHMVLLQVAGSGRVRKPVGHVAVRLVPELLSSWEFFLTRGMQVAVVGVTTSLPLLHLTQQRVAGSA